MKIIIQPHSFVDLITNSSTEIFIIDDNKNLQIIKEIIDNLQKEHPNEYNEQISVDYTSEYDLCPVIDYNFYEEDIPKMVRVLEQYGYLVTPPNDNKEQNRKYISITCERGYINQEIVDFINKNFNVVYYDTNN